MGGMGSGRWGGHRPAVTVERCRRVDLGAVVRGHDPPPASGELRWFRGDEVAATVGYDVVRSGDGVVLALRYRWTHPALAAGGRDVVLDVRMEKAALPRGGCRWWGRCPLAAGGAACGRRVGALYLPPGSAYFGCRHCHRLTYASRQEHDPRVTRLLRDPDRLHRLGRNPRGLGVPMLGLLLKALTVQQARDDRWFRRWEKRYGRRPAPNGRTCDDGGDGS